MKSFLIDTNVVLDVLLDRQPFADAAVRLLARIEAGEFEGYVTLKTAPTLAFNSFATAQLITPASL